MYENLNMIEHVFVPLDCMTTLIFNLDLDTFLYGDVEDVNFIVYYVINCSVLMLFIFCPDEYISVYSGH